MANIEFSEPKVTANDISDKSAIVARLPIKIHEVKYSKKCSP